MKHNFVEYKHFLLQIKKCQICNKDKTDLHFDYGNYHSKCLDELMKNAEKE